MANESELPFDYVKSNLFRVIHADGAIGSLTPSGGIHMAFYSERPALPRRLVHHLDSDGKVGAIIPDLTESRESIVREMDVDVMMSMDAARALLTWLTEKVVERDNLHGSLQK